MSCDDERETEIQSIDQQIDSYLDARVKNNDPGLCILIKHKGEIMYSRSKGYAQVSNMLPINTDTQFRSGSISKSITALAIMQLVEEGKLNLSTKLIDVLQPLPATYDNITIEHLLSHQSGLLDYIDDNNDLSSLDNLTSKNILNIIPGSGLENLQFSPGSSADYSNTGYALLALIIEKIGGLSYPDYLKQNIFEPLGMSNSFVIWENEHLGDKGDNYALSFGTNLKVKGINSLIYGANGVVSTAEDLMILADAITQYQVVNEASLTEMRSKRSSITEIADYGLGWMLGCGQYWHTSKYSDVNDYWHMGGFDGYRTILSINPNLELKIVILTNNGQKSQDEMLDIVELTRKYLKN